MKRLIFALAAALSLASSSSSPAAAAEHTVTFKSGTETASGLLVTPEGTGPFPAVVVIHEWWGLDDWVKDQARALAREGYVALAPDLYRGKVTDKQEEAHQLMMGLPPDRALRDLKAAVAHLQARPDMKKDRIGVIGWCMGGKYALELATQEPALRAVVVYYGAPPTDEAALARIKAPVLGNFGADDKGPSPEQVKAFEAAMKKAGQTVDIKIHPGAGHAFANPKNPWGGYREAAAKDAWARTLAFLNKHLKA
ncbi:MAG TPA: dienelactone hydrolase family protein [Vicinamibacteria bacterium]|nr:dienelactone hydrolase family protein [Vicinamibacteria bacterium]